MVSKMDIAKNLRLKCVVLDVESDARCISIATVGPKIFAWTIFSDGNYFRIFAYAKSRTVILEYLHSKTLLVVCQYKF